MAEKVTTMVMEVDLQCATCYKKVKKVLCKIPQIRNHSFDEKQNKVTITVVCCSPEKIRDKLYCKGGMTIKCIKIVQPPKQTKGEKPETPTDKDKKEKPIVDPPPPTCQGNQTTPTDKDEKEKPMVDPPAPTCQAGVVIGICCGLCYEGRAGGPCYCYHGHGRLVPCCDGYYGYGGCSACSVSRCDIHYYSEENYTVCTIL